MSLRWRLNLALIALLTVATILFGGYDIYLTESQFSKEVDRQLALRAASLAAQLRLDATDGLSELEVSRALDSVDDDLDQVEVLDSRGGHWKGATLGARGEPGLATRPGNPALRILTLPVLDSRGIHRATVVVARSLADIQAELHEWTQTILFANLLGGLVVMLAVSLILSRSLAPLKEMARTAKEVVESQDFGRRVRELASDDELGQMSRAFNAMVSEVEGLLEEQRAWLADTSHELRNPLAVLRTNVEFLGHELDSETRSQIVAESENEIARLTRLIEDLRSLTSSEGAGFERIDVDLAELATQTLERLRPLAGDRQLILQLEEPGTVSGDLHRLSQVVENLLTNAIRYTDPPARILVLVRGSTIIVEDDGIGIPSESLPHIFDRFYRVDQARSRETGGTGLGLAIARTIAERHGGTLEVSSTLGKGSCFTLRLSHQLQTRT